MKIAMAALSVVAVVGCAPPPPRIAVPTAENRSVTVQHDVVKPMPGEVGEGAPPAPAGGYYDEPLVVQRPPEQRAFVDAYYRVGRPHIVVFVNRTLNGAMVPATDSRPLGEAEAHPLSGGQYDEVSAQALDYEALENVLTDWLSANGQVTVMSPTMTRAKLTREQIDALEKGEKFVLSDIAQRCDGDVFVQVQAHPTRQTPYGMEIRVLAEAINVRGGQSLGRAFVDVPPPLEKRQINQYTRFLARKLMDDLTGAWNAPGPAPEAANPPAVTPANPAAPVAPANPPAPVAPATPTPPAPAPTTR